MDWFLYVNGPRHERVSVPYYHKLNQVMLYFIYFCQCLRLGLLIVRYIFIIVLIVIVIFIWTFLSKVQP